MIIRTCHAREVDFCVTGMREFCVKHGLSFREFCLKGYPEEVLLATNDAMAKQLVEVAHGE